MDETKVEEVVEETPEAVETPVEETVAEVEVSDSAAQNSYLNKE